VIGCLPQFLCSELVDSVYARTYLAQTVTPRKHESTKRIPMGVFRGFVFSCWIGDEMTSSAAPTIRAEEKRAFGVIGIS
jgi:hypothetical protein